MHGREVPKLLVVPETTEVVRLPSPLGSGEHVPEWLAELMSEMARRHDLLSIDGLDCASAEAVRTAADLELRSKSCASLACGYRAAA